VAKKTSTLSRGRPSRPSLKNPIETRFEVDKIFEGRHVASSSGLIVERETSMSLADTQETSAMARRPGVLILGAGFLALAGIDLHRQS
jgi:hypothetical protein